MAVTLSLFAGAGAQFFDNNGNVLSGGKIYTYQAGTTTPLAVYTTNSAAAFHTNPIVLDAAGRVPSGGEIWLQLGVGYKFVVKTSTEVLIATYDNIPTSAQPPAANDADSIMYEQGYTVTAGSFVVGKIYRIVSVGTTDFTLIGSVSNVVGTHFIATGAGTGTGTAELSQTVETKLRQVVSVNDFGASPSLADNLTALQAAANYACSLGNAELVIPAGIYEFSASRYVSTSNQDGIIIDVPDNGVLVIRGAGAGATIMRRKASATLNNFASMFIIKNNTNATVLFQDLEIDGNAENITPSVPGDFTYQQTAMVRIQTGTGQMRMLGADNVSMSNPTADGFYFSAQIAACSFSNIYQINRNRTRSDIEFTFVPNRVLISNCNLKDLQAEPAPVTCEAFVVENVVTDHLDIIGNNINTDTFNLFLSNVKATEADGRDTLIRRIKNGHFTNCEFVNIKRLQDVNGTFTNCRLIQRVVAGAVQGVQLDYLTDYPTVLRFDSCHFEAESAGTGAMIQAFTVIANTRTHIPELHVKNCTSDKNAAFFLDANRIGIAYVENSQVKGTTAAFNTSNTAGNVCKLYLKNNTYDAPNVIQMAGTADSVLLVDDIIDGDAISPCTRANSSGSTITFQSKRKILVTASPESSINGLTGDVASLKATGTAGWREWTFTGSSGLNTGWRLSRQRFHNGTTANRPTLGVADSGYQYFDTTLDADGKPIWWTGTAWVDATGATV